MPLEYLLIIKAIHIIFVVSYFAGIFYIVRLFIYHTEAQEKPHAPLLFEQFQVMERRLWNIIIVPAGLIMLFSGLSMLFFKDYLLSQAWMHVKIFFLIILLAYHFWCWRTMKSIHQNNFKYSSVQLRMANEVATLILFVVVFAVVLKQLLLIYWYWILISFVLLGLLIMLVVKISNKK